ncbi:MAG: hypothetical protein AAB649_03170 [Patescibacteria group bacterium]
MENNVAKHEFMIVGAALLLFGFIALYSIIYARSAVRDDLRKQDITNMKHALEQYYNTHESYIAPHTGLPNCTSSSKDSWFFGDNSPLIQGQFIDAIPHDVRESRGYIYTYCASGINNNGARGYVLEASMESNMTEGVFFDEDEQRKFDYRVLLEKGILKYRVCGGEEDQCKEPKL